MGQMLTRSQGAISRRSFVGTAGLAVGAAGAGLLAKGVPAFADGGLTQGDAAILRFLAALEIRETDLWQQYNELAGIQDSEVPGGSGNPAYAEAVAVLDEDMNQYIHDNTDDEISHFTFINAFLEENGADTVKLDQFRTLPSSQATGAERIGRLTNLMQLTVDTSWWTTYRSELAEPRLRRHPAASHPGSGRRPASGDSAQRRRPQPARPPASDRQHGRVPLCLHRTRRHQPLCLARPAGN